MDDRDEGTGADEVTGEGFGDLVTPGDTPQVRPQVRFWDEPEMRATREFFRSSGGSVFFLLSAVSIFCGLSTIVGPILGTSSALRQTLPAIGTIGVYEVSLFVVMLALALWWRITRDTVSLFLLVAIFLITLGMLVSTVANDAPITVLGAGAAVVALAWLELALARRWMRVPMHGWLLGGVAWLLAWNGLCAAFLAQYIGADVNDVRSVLDVWQYAAGVPIVGAVMLYLGAALLPKGHLREEQARDAFLRSPGMAWVFAGAILAGTAVHQYAMRYVFDLPFYLVDYVPLIGIAALTAIELARGYGAIGRWLPIPALAAPAAILLAILEKSYDVDAGLGAGLLIHPALMLVGLGVLLLWTMSRLRLLEFAGVVVVYAVGFLILARPAHINGVEAINGDLVWMCVGLLAVPVLLVFRNPTLWTLACGAAAVVLPRTNAFANLVDYQFMSGDVSVVWSSAIFGTGVVLTYIVFGPRMPRWIAGAGAVLLSLSALGISMHEEPVLSPVVVALGLALASAAIYWRTDDALIAAALCLPLARLGYVSFAEAGAWRFMVLGFVLLAMGAVWSVHGERLRTRQAEVKSQP